MAHDNAAGIGRRLQPRVTGGLFASHRVASRQRTTVVQWPSYTTGLRIAAVLADSVRPRSAAPSPAGSCYGRRPRHTPVAVARRGCECANTVIRYGQWRCHRPVLLYDVENAPHRRALRQFVAQADALRVRANKGCHWVDGGAQRGMRNMFACLYTPLCRMRVLLCCACCAPRALHADVCRACQRIRRLPPLPCCVDDSFGVDAAWRRATVL